MPTLEEDMADAKDIVVIGGGIIGLACAHYLSLDGRKVVLIDQDRIGAGASHGNCGLLFFSHLMPLCTPGVIAHHLRRIFRRDSPLYISPRPDWRRLAWLVRFAAHCTYAHLQTVMRARAAILKASALLYDELFASWDLPCELHRQGVLLVYRSAAAMAAYAATHRSLQRFGHGARFLPAKEAFRLEPALDDELAGAWFHPHDSHLRPDVLLASWKTLLQARGVEIVENCRLDDIRSHRGHIDTVVTSAGVWRPQAVVLATGAWTGPIARRFGIYLSLEAGKGYSLTMARPAAGPRRACYFHDASVVATPWESGLRLGGTMEFSGLNDTIEPQRMANLKTAAAGYLKTGLDGRVAEQWVGLRPVMADDLPVIDRVPGLPGLVIATGHGMMGLSMAPATGRIVADLVAARTPAVDATAFAITRTSRGSENRRSALRAAHPTRCPRG